MREAEIQGRAVPPLGWFDSVAASWLRDLGTTSGCGGDGRFPAASRARSDRRKSLLSVKPSPVSSAPTLASASPSRPLNTGLANAARPPSPGHYDGPPRDAQSLWDRPSVAAGTPGQWTVSRRVRLVPTAWSASAATLARYRPLLLTRTFTLNAERVDVLRVDSVLATVR